MNFENQTITITFGEKVENGPNQQQIGSSISEGLSCEEIKNIKKRFSSKFSECKSIIVNLKIALPDSQQEKAEDASILIVRNGARLLLESESKVDDLFKELQESGNGGLKWDSKYFDVRRQKVLNKRARHNLCFGPEHQDADYKNKKGTIYAFEEVPILSKLRDEITNLCENKKIKDLFVEGNRYYDISKTGIGFHGDGERKITIGVRLGETIPLHYFWYHKTNRIGERIKITLNHGDIYFMSNKATGNDAKKRNILTLRHAAGCENYLK